MDPERVPARDRLMVDGFHDDVEFAGLLVRDSAGFVLRCDDGTDYRLELLRTPIDAVEKHVIVTGAKSGDGAIEADGVRIAHGR